MIDATNRNTALASALVEELARSGVRRAIVSPGSRSSPVALALDREPAIELTVVVDERSAGFVALGCALASGAVVALACTSGSAAANLHPAIVEAAEAGVPLIALTSDRPPELRGVGAGQTIDQIGLYGSAARWFCEVGTHAADDSGLLHMRATACRAVAEATAGRGPVQLNLSWRDPLGPEPRADDVSARSELALRGRAAGRALTHSPSAREPGAELLAELRGALGRSERALIVAGRLPDPGLPAAIAELAAAAAMPILAEPTSGLRLGPDRGARVIAAYDAILRQPHPALAPDLVLRFGDLPTSKPLRAWLAALAADQIAIDPPGRWNEPTRRAATLLRADATAIARGLGAGVAAQRSGWPASWSAAESAAQAAIDDVLGAAPAPSEPAVHRRLASALGDGEQLLLASSMPIRDAEAFLPAGGPAVRAFANRGANGIDGTVSTGCGLAIGAGAPTWIVLGDLALQHDLGGLAAVAAAPGPLRILVIDNGGGGIFDFLPQAEQIETGAFTRLFTAPSALDLASAAGLFGLDYAEIEDLDQLAELRRHERVLARVGTDRHANVALHRRIAAAAAAAVAAALA